MNGFLQMLRASPAGEQAGELGVGTLVISMLLLLFAVLGMGILFVWLVRRHLRSRALQPLHDAPPHPSWGLMRLPNMWFDSTCRWLAIRTNDSQAVLGALHLHNTTTCSWEEGLAEARESKLFISPPIGEWVLVVGSGLPDPGDDPDVCYHFLTSLSRKLGHVQFFSFNRVVHHHAWARLEGGNVLRAYAWSGHTAWTQGKMTLAERDLGLNCREYGEVEPPVEFGQPNPAAQNAERVPGLAARWSVDPTAIDPRHFSTGSGIAGESSSRPSK